ncbi:MAG: DNA double-strand break repair nuclease NurA [Deltaproteobacteria bacterium]|nr:MAG: DNA double-strand break repair nuclease NurA [Deltaproteobacteria bacterium]
MLDPRHVLQALETKREEFASFQRRTLREQAETQEQLEHIGRSTLTEVLLRLSHEPWPGARPTQELDHYGSLTVPFEATFAHHQESRAWAKDKLLHRTTFAVDGSQLMPNKELSVPVAVVQIGWFLNPHQAGQPFEKQVRTQVLGPEELLSSGSEEKLFHDQHISLRRYEMEAQRLQEFCTLHAEQTPPPMGLFDGSLLISFAEVLKDFHRHAYLQAALSLLKTSQETKIPVLGYVDTSVARDVLRMMALFLGQEPSSSYEGLRDSDMLASLLPRWGDRTIAFALARPGILREYGEMSEGLGFCYLRTSMDRPPVRVEFPLWLVDDGILDDVLNLLRAEAIVGNGYPYALETADQAAWFAPQDRSRFANLLRRFLDQQDMPLQSSNKLQSKQRRRGAQTSPGPGR